MYVLHLPSTVIRSVNHHPQLWILEIKLRSSWLPRPRALPTELSFQFQTPFSTKQNHFIVKTSASSKFQLLILTLWSLCDATWPWFSSLTPILICLTLLQHPLSLSSGIPLSTFSLPPLGSFFPHLHFQIHPHSESRPAPISVPPVRSSLMTYVQINLYLVSKLWS